jgi:hypothetical protein
LGYNKHASEISFCLGQKAFVGGHMTDQSKPKPPRPDRPGYVDGIPVEELVRLTREFTSRITNEDRQRLQLDYQESSRSLQTPAPHLIQQFLVGMADLDQELLKLFPTVPLLSSATFTPTPGKRAKRGFAQIKSQDEAASLTFNVMGIDGTFDLSFVLGGMLSLRFGFGPVADAKRAAFLELLRRPNGISIWWQKELWERDYVVFVVRERFARLYAFSPRGIEAACRLSPDILAELVEWLRAFWLLEG